MAEGILERMQRLYDNADRTSQSSAAMSDDAFQGALRTLNTPRQNDERRRWAGLAAGFGTPGHFGIGAGVAARNYGKALSDEDDEDYQRQMKVYDIKNAHAALMERYSQQRLNSGIQRFGLPAAALNAMESEEDYNDYRTGGGGSDIPAMPTRRAPAAVDPGVPPGPAPAPAIGPAPAPAPPSPPRGEAIPQDVPNPGASMPGSQLSAIEPEGDDSVYYPDTGNAIASADDGFMPQQVAQAGPPTGRGQSPPAQAAPVAQGQAAPTSRISQEDRDLYQWAQDVRQAAARDPDRWQRRRKNKNALGLADKIISDFDRRETADVRQQNAGALLDLREKVQQSREAQAQAAPTPFERRQQMLDANRLDASRSDAASASKSIGDLNVIEELRKQPQVVGPWGQYVTRLLDKLPGGFGGGQALEARGVDMWVRMVEPLKGALSTAEGNRFDAANPASLAMNDAPAKTVIALAKAAAHRLEQKNLYLEMYYQQNGTLTGSEQNWSKFIEEKPILTVDPKTGQERFLTQNIDAWRDYLLAPEGVSPGRRGPADSAPGRSSPGLSREDVIEELRRRGAVK